MLDYFVNALVTLFVTIDPIGMGPMFLVLTAGMAAAERQRTALTASVIAAIVLVAFVFAGATLLSALGISLPAFRIAGGLLLFAIAFEMVFEQRDRRKSATVRKATDDDESPNVAVFPLAIPLISGPGAISATILLAARAAGPLDLFMLAAVIVGLIFVCFVVFQLASGIDHYLGATGRIVVSRMLGVILAALSVQFVADGVLAFVHGEG